jgi:hypothetical protein
LLLELELDAGYSYNLMPSAAAPPGTGAFRRLDSGEYLGRKGRSLPGSHRRRGLFIACGPQVQAGGEIHADIADVSATLLARMQMHAPHALDGRVLQEALRPNTLAALHMPCSTQPVPQRDPPLFPEHTARVEERLRRLGYIE